MKKVIFALVAFLTTGAFADLTMYVTGTADSSVLGYVAGQSYSFAVTVSSAYTGGTDTFSTDRNLWSEKTTDPNLWTGISGDGISGAYSRSASPNSYILTREYSAYQRLTVTMSTMTAPADFDTGIIVNGMQSTFYAYINLDKTDPGFSFPLSFVNPVTFLEGYQGTYTPYDTLGKIQITTSDSTVANMTVTGLTIGAVPEPASAMLFFAGFGVVGLVRRHLCC